MRLPLMLLAAWLGLSSSVAARDIFVNNAAGDDQRTGGSPTSEGRAGGPFRTISRALRAAGRGDRIILANTGQPYHEAVTLLGPRHSGYPDQPLLIEGNGAVLDGSQETPAGSWEHFRGDVFRFRPQRLAWQQLFLDGKPARRRLANRQGEDPPELAPLEWSLHRGHIYFRVERDALPQQYALSHAALPAGVTLFQVRHVAIRDLVIQGFQLDGVNAHDGVEDAALVGLTCRGNGRSGISVGGACRVRIEACLVGNNGDAQVRSDGWSRTEIVHCDLLDNTAPPVVRVTEHAQVTMANGQ